MFDTQSPDHTDGQRLAFDQRVILLCPTLSYWRGRYQLPRKSTEVRSAGTGVEASDITVPQAKLLADTYPLDANGTAWRKRFGVIESKLEEVKAAFSIAFPINGVRIVPKHRAADLMHALIGLTVGDVRRQVADARAEGRHSDADAREQTLYQVFNKDPNATNRTPVFDVSRDSNDQSVAYMLYRASQEFCDNWEDIKQQMAEHNTAYHLVSGKLPVSMKELRAKFSLDIVPIELAGGTRTAEVTADDLLVHNDIVQETCRRRVQEAIDAMIQEPRQQLRDALENLSAVIARDGRITSRTFNAVREAISKIRLFDFVADSQLLQQIELMEQRLNTTATASLSSVTAAHTGFQAAVDSLLEEVSNETKIATVRSQFGMEERNLLL